LKDETLLESQKLVKEKEQNKTDFLLMCKCRVKRAKRRFVLHLLCHLEKRQAFITDLNNVNNAVEEHC